MEVLYSSPASVALSRLSSQTCSASRPNPSTRSQGHPDLRFKRPTVAMGTISTLSALLRSAWSEAICPLLILHPSYPSTPSLFFLLSKKKKKKSSILKRHDYSFSYSFSQIHSPTMFGTSNLLSSSSHSHSIQPL